MPSQSSSPDEERLGELIALLPPAPGAWVEAAQQIPNVERGVTQILALSATDAEFRHTLGEDLERAIRAAGQEPSRALIRTLQDRLGTPDIDGA